MTIKTDYIQRHFIVYEIVLPYCAVCTSNQDDSSLWYTPLTCVESSDSEYSLFFTSNDAPFIDQPSVSITGKSILNSSIFRCVKTASEATPLLKGGTGLASRSTMNVTFSDFKGDPGPINFSDDGSFFGKLIARNVLNGKKIKTHYYTKVNADSLPVIVGTSEHFITSFQLSNDVCTIKAKDALKDIEQLTQKFPEPSDLVLTSSVSSSALSFSYSGSPSLSAGDLVIIGSEFIRVNTANSSSFTTVSRGATVVENGTTLSITINTSHSSGNTVQLCRANAEGLADTLSFLFTQAGLASFIDITQWNDEIDSWNLNADVNAIFFEPETYIDIINKLLIEYMLDMWLDQSSQKILIASVSSWKHVQRSLVEGADFSDIKINEDSDARYSRAFINTGKDNKALNDDLVNFNRTTIQTDLTSETSDFYGDIKVKDFGSSSTLAEEDAKILCGRFIERYGKPPKKITFNMEERQLADLILGNVVDIFSRTGQGADGTTVSSQNRAQIVRIQPELNKIGRSYKVTAMSYIAANENSLLIFSNDSFRTINIHSELNAPGVAVDVTVVLDGAIFGSGKNEPSITAEGLHPDSTVTIYMINGAIWSARGAEGLLSFVVIGSGENSYNSAGIETIIYINYEDTGGYIIDGSVFAAGGGGGAVIINNYNVIGGGGGGSGFPAGIGAVSSIASASGGNGTLLTGGSGATISFGGSIARSGNGGDSDDGDDGVIISVGLGAFAGEGSPSGYAFSGGNIIVYNTDSAKLKDGRSTAGVDYILVDEVRDHSYEHSFEFN